MTEVILLQSHVGEWDFVQTHPTLPLALLSLSTFLEGRYKVKIIDQRVDKNWERNLRRELNQNPICVGTTSMTGRQIKHALEISKVVKESSPETPVVWGGVHPSLLPKQTLENENIDLVVKGEGEITFYELVKSLDKEKSLKGIKGVWYKENGKVKSNPDRHFLDLNTLPDLPYHLVDVGRYLPRRMDKPTIYLETSRGCPHRCAFCCNIVYNKRCWRSLTPEKMLKKVKKVIDDFKIENIYFVDDNFFVDLERIEKIAKGFIKEGYDVSWEVEGMRVDSASKMDRRYLKTLEKSGFKKVDLGVESGSERILKLIKKDINIGQVKLVNKKFKETKIKPWYHFMSGFPTETLGDLKKTISLMFYLLRENPKAVISRVSVFTPFPGTGLFEVAKKMGLKEPLSLEEWSAYGADNVVTPWLSRGERDMLESLYLSSMFLDTKSRDYLGSELNKILAELYRPIAKYRVRNFFFDYMIEKKVKEFILAR